MEPLFSLTLFTRDFVYDVPANAIFDSVDGSSGASVLYFRSGPNEPETGAEDPSLPTYDKRRFLMLSDADVAQHTDDGTIAGFTFLTDIPNGGEILHVYEVGR